MADELRPDEIPDLWHNQPVEPANMSIDEVRRKHNGLRRRPGVVLA